MSVDLAAVLSVAGALGMPVTILIYRWMRLRLIRHIYDKGGASDAVAVIAAMRVFSPRRHRPAARSQR